MDGKLYPVWIRVDDGDRSVITSVVGIDQIPTGTGEVCSYADRLFQNFPNPFSGNTTISFQVGAHEYVTLRIYDAAGKEVAELVNGMKKPGEYNASFNASGLKGGTYFATLSIGDWSTTRGMLLMQ